jgi:hypothetical protein
MNMLGAAQNQLFDTSGDQITGFKPYTPYSSDPTDYFAGPSSLQRSTYNEASGMGTPGQFAPATGMAAMSGMGQFGTAQQAGMYGGLGTALGAAGAMQAMPAFGAGQQFASQVTNPNSMAQYMSPYQQQVTDIAKADAVRNAQMMEQGNRLSAARQGTYGGARQALASLEREKNLASNLSNIQAQGSQTAYDKAMQTQQFGANLGLQGIQTGLQGVQAGMQGVGQGLQGVGAQQAGYAGAGQAASTLGQLGGAQQQADIARLGLQNQLGGQQQQYQQGIINQAIQDYATAQQYPYMQLSTMSNLLRGLPMQGMTTQQYQAQPTALQQSIGLLGTGASLYGAMKREGGTIKEYAAGGTIRGLENKIDDIGDAGGAKGLQALLAKTKSPQAKELIMERMREEGIAAGNVGKLGTNMAGGGIVAFEAGGGVGTFGGMGFDNEELDRYAQRKSEEKIAEKRKLQEEFLAANAPEALAALRKREANAAANPVVPNSGFTESSFKDFDQAQALFEKERFGGKPPAAAPANTDTNTNANTSTGLDAIIADRRKRLGFDGDGEKNQAFMKALEERQTGMGKERESDRYLRMAEAFAKFGSSAGPIGATAAEALGGFAKGEGAARRDEDKMKLEGMKMQADLEKARRAEARGDLDAAEKFYGNVEDRKNRLEAANISASASRANANLDKESIERIMKEEGVSYAQALERVKGAGRSEGIDMQIGKEAYKTAAASVAPGGANSKKYKELMKTDPTGAAAKQFVTELAQEQIRGMKAAMGMGGGGGGGGGNVDSSNPLLKR